MSADNVLFPHAHESLHQFLASEICLVRPKLTKKASKSAHTACELENFCCLPLGGWENHRCKRLM